MPLTKANYKLPEHKKKESKSNDKEERRKFEEEAIRHRGAKGSFMIFREEGLEDVFVADDL